LTTIIFTNSEAERVGTMLEELMDLRLRAEEKTQLDELPEEG